MTIVMSGQLSKDEVAKLLERITVSDTKSGNREITPMESASTQEKIVPVSHCNRSMEFKVPDIKCAFHISIGMDNKPWTSDDSGILVRTDIHGNRFQILLTNGRYESFHSVTRES